MIGIRLHVAATVCGVMFLQQADAATLTSPAPLVTTYELILDARFEEAGRQLTQACPPAPQPACEILGAVADYWKMLLDPEQTSGDAALTKRIDASIASAETWVAREPARAEAWFYLGGAYGTRVLLRGHRGQHLSAARDGSRIHDSLQRSIALDRSIGDAYFGLGLYHYYAAIAPRVARILRALMFLPAGDRAGGLKEMEQTRSQGLLLRGEADYQLHLIYLWYERQPMTALHLIEGLRARYPHNPVFYLRLAQVQADYFSNHAAALQTYRMLLDAARSSRIAAPAISEMDARLGMAREMDALCETENAIEQLRLVIAQRPSAPYAALARAHYQLGVALDRAGRRSEAVTAYQHALAEIPRDDRLRVRERAREALRRAATRACR